MSPVPVVSARTGGCRNQVPAEPPRAPVCEGKGGLKQYSGYARHRQFSPKKQELPALLPVFPVNVSDSRSLIGRATRLEVYMVI